MKNARILKGVGGLYTAEILSENNTGTNETVLCRAKGTFRHDGTKVLPGDIIEFEEQKDGTGFITHICQRKNSVIRPQSANLDLFVFVIAAAKPSPDLFLIDKILAVVTHNDIDVLIIVNKSDLDQENAQKICDLYNLSGYKTISFSAKNPHEDTKNFIQNYVKGKICFFAGASGVGKSSTINAVFSDMNFALETGSLSEKIQRGKHTTRKTELFKIFENTYIADTPGFSMLEIAQYNLIPKNSLIASFPDIEKYSLGCKYSDCTHICEDGCNVITAISQNKLSATRHESYKLLFEELKNKNEWD